MTAAQDRWLAQYQRATTEQQKHAEASRVAARQRQQAIHRLHQSGLSLAQLAALTDLTRARVQQLVRH